jgi:hypothetical protein
LEGVGYSKYAWSRWIRKNHSEDNERFFRLRSQPTSGKKHELAKQIFDLSELEEVPVQGPLAAAYNIEEDDNLDAGGDDESEIDA